MRSILLSFLFLLAVSAQEERELDWWEKSVFYQIYPRSFKDSDGDGIGDINGITESLEYLKEIGVEATWINPIFKSPMYDFGYDTSDFYAINPEYGTLEDFDRLLAKAKELDIKILLDFVPNHTSNESVWFQEALKHHEKYYNYFIWEDGIIDEEGNMHPPNNWLSVFRKSAWEYKEEVGKYYLHQFVIGQPDLNYRNPDVVEEMENILRFWLDKGIAGFRIDAISHMFEADKEKFGGKYPDEPKAATLIEDTEHHDTLDHIHTKELDETFDMIYKWRELFDEYTAKDGVTRVMMTEAYADTSKVVRYFGNGTRVGAHIPYNFVLITNVDGSSTAHEIKVALDEFITYKPLDKTPNWVSGNHDNNRVASRYTPELADGLNMITLLMPGVGFTYMGEEIGMVDGFVSWEDTVDPRGCNTDDPVNYVLTSRDPARTPFQWNADKNAGFSTADKTWLPVAAGYKTLNVQAQRGVPKSHLTTYKTIVQLRNQEVFLRGRFESLAFNNDVYAFRRWYNSEKYVVVVNFRDVPHTIDLRYFENILGQAEVAVSSTQSTKATGDLLDVSHVDVSGYESFVVKVIN